MKFKFLKIFKMNPESRENAQWEGEEPTSLATDLVDKDLVKGGTHLLDLGCGFGRNSNWLASKGVIVDAINNNDEELEKAKERASKQNVNVNYVKADAGALPFSDASFDVILDAGCTHMCDEQTQNKSVLEAYRLLKTDGYLQYFGFSKEHPGYQRNPNSPQFRDMENIREQYGKYFEIEEPKKREWEHNGEKHIGLEILMKKK